MEKGRKIKRILDSVHGYIDVPSDIIRDFIDTKRFQRLRRIEQTSGRSIYPSAHHDRFIHSLGVYHIGRQIVDHLKSNAGTYIDAPVDDLVFQSYLMACLLHDVCHAPFSHTFEDKFGKAGLLKKLQGSMKEKDETFETESNRYFSKIASHEIMSAYVALTEFSEKIQNNRADPTLVVRMICGVPYSTEGLPEEAAKKNGFKNAMIELIHGDIIDADGMDYACRDAWASGYDTNNVDVERLIGAIELHPDNENGLYRVCYSSKALNAIESVLGVKTFQQYNVINHHKVVYEQELIKKAVEQAAYYHWSGKRGEELDKDEKNKCLKGFYDFDMFFKPKELEGSKCRLFSPMDDDYVHLMKYIDDDVYVKQWLSRDYDLMPLWKSPAEFYEIFDYLQDKQFIDKMWLFSDKCCETLSEKFGIPTEQIWILPANGSEKRAKAVNIWLWVNDRMCKYTDLYRDHKDKFAASERPFFFIYVPKGADRIAIIKFLKEETQTKVF